MSKDDKDKQEGRRDFIKIAGSALAGAASVLITQKFKRGEEGQAEFSSSENVDFTYPSQWWDRLSSPHSELKAQKLGKERNPHFYDMVVIGSGYGASAVARRAAIEFKKMGRSAGSVIVLERGKEWAPGEYPDTLIANPTKALSKSGIRNFRTPLNPLGLWDVTIGRDGGDLDVISGNALGGTSTVNANIALEPLPQIFDADKFLSAEFFNPDNIKAFGEAEGQSMYKSMMKDNPWKMISNDIRSKYGDKGRAYALNIESLRPYMDEVRTVLNVETFPDPDGDDANVILGPPSVEQKKLPALGKVRAMKSVWKKVFDNDTDDAKFRMVPMAVNLTKTKEGQRNPQGVKQRPCNMCGDCVTGCNVGAKNTLIMNYLPDAKRNGAKIFTQTEVVHIEKVPGGYKIIIKEHKTDRLVGAALQGLRNNLEKAFSTTTNLRAVYTRTVSVGAGALGSTKILMRSRNAAEETNSGFKFSEGLGHGFSGNADILGFGYNGVGGIDAAGYGVHANAAKQNNDLTYNVNDGARNAVGPCIVSMIDMRHNPRKGFLIEEGAFPSMLVGPMKRSLSTMLRGRMREAINDLDDPTSGAGEEYGLISGKKVDKESLTENAMAAMDRDQVTIDENDLAPLDGAFNRSMCNLAMGYDSSSGFIDYDESSDTLQIRFRGNADNFNSSDKAPGYRSLGTETPHIQANKDFERMAEHFKSLNIRNFRTTRQGSFDSNKEGGIPVSVHALGGCNMAVDRNSGTIDHKNRVFDSGSDDPRAVHEGFYVVCGAALPTSTGSNPFLTITSVATRAADLMFNDPVFKDENLDAVIERKKKEQEEFVKNNGGADKAYETDGNSWSKSIRKIKEGPSGL